jgi:hypothetical protein
MIEGMALIGARNTWRLQHSAAPDAPVVPDPPPRERRVVVRAHLAGVLRRTAELLEPVSGPVASHRHAHP